MKICFIFFIKKERKIKARASTLQYTPILFLFFVLRQGLKSFNYPIWV